MNKAKTQIGNIKKNLKGLYNKESFLKIILGLNIVLVVTLLLNIVLVLVELSGVNSVNERTVLFYVGVVSSIACTVVFIGLPLIRILQFFRSPNYTDLSEKIGQHYPEVSDDLTNAIEISEVEDDYFSKTLTAAAIDRVYKKVENLDFKKTVSFDKSKKHFLTSAATIIVTVFLFYFVPNFRLASYRIINYSNEFKTPPKLILYVEPGSTSVTKNSDVIIKVETIGETPKAITVSTKSEEEPKYIKHKILPDSSGTFSYRINSIKKTVEYFAEAEKIISEVYKISVIDKPIISLLQLKITPPKYSGLKEYKQKDNGNIKELTGSRIDLKIKSTKELLSGHLLFSDSLRQNLSVTGAKASTAFSIIKNNEYKIIIFDSTGNKNKNPVTYSIISKGDEYPTLKVIEPQDETKLTKSEKVLTQLKIRDDYGFNKLLLHYRLSASNFETPSENFSTTQITLNIKQLEQDVFFVWDVSELFLAAGDVVSIYFEIFDNDYVSGPKSTKSSIFTLYVPTMEELLQDSDTAHEEAIKEIEETLKEAEKLNEELEKISDELKLDKKEIDWSEKKKIEDATKKFEELKNKIEHTQKKLAENQNELEQNELLSKETLEKYNELQELMNEMRSEEMKKAMQKLQQQLNSMNRENVQKSLEDMKFDEEMFRKSLERTMNLVKRVQIEQKMDEIVKRTNELEESLSDLEKETQKSDLSNEKEKNKLAEKQKEITKKLEKLEQELKKLKEKMSDVDDMPNDQMEQLQEEMKSQKNEERSEETQQQLTQQMKMEALENMQQLSKNMQRTSEQMQGIQQQMQMQNQLQTMYDMMKAVSNLIELSKQQEQLKKSTEGKNSNQMSQKTQTQNEILAGLEKTIKQLSELSQKTFAITPEMGRALGQAKAEMNNSMNAMQNGNSSMAVQGQSGAMKSLNEAASMMKGKMDQMMNGGQGGGMMSMMQQMQQLSQQQMNLNKLTQQLNKGELNPQQQMELNRLSQQQETIRKSLEQLNREGKESGESKRIASNLDKVLEEMSEVIMKMQTETVNNDLIQSQERILSKLLDAQRSINQRDFDDQRESNSGNKFNRESPGEINLSAEERKNKIREELIKARKEGYSQDYEELIRKYYEALDESKDKTPANK